MGRWGGRDSVKAGERDFEKKKAILRGHQSSRPDEVLLATLKKRGPSTFTNWYGKSDIGKMNYADALALAKEKKGWKPEYLRGLTDAEIERQYGRKK